MERLESVQFRSFLGLLSLVRQTQTPQIRFEPLYNLSSWRPYQIWSWLVDFGEIGTRLL